LGSHALPFRHAEMGLYFNFLQENDVHALLYARILFF
jgi:hypothetical protein